MTRIRATLVHLLLTAVVLAAIAWLVFEVWYPAPLLRFQGGGRPLFILALTAVLLGPMLTLVVFKPGKKGLWYDLIVIPILQLAAIAWGLWTLYQSRPDWVVFSKDRFFVLTDAELVDAPGRGGWLDSPKVVDAPVWRDPDAALEVIVGARPHSHLVGERYQPIATALPQLRQAALDAAGFTAAERERIAKTAEDGRLAKDDVLLLPLHGRRADGVAMVSARSGELLGVLDVDPQAHE